MRIGPPADPRGRPGGGHGVSAIACGLYPATMDWPGVSVAVLIGTTVPDSAQAAYAVLP